jgi:hypothetical protein
MGALLGQISHESVDEGGPMISAIVIYLDRNDAGGGFYNLAVELGLLRAEPTARQRDAFWTGQVAETHRQYARPRRR